MSLVVAILVAALAYLYIRSNRQAKIRWHSRLNLPGVWRSPESELGAASHELRLAGNFEGGDFVEVVSAGDGPSQTRKGRWRLVGNALVLTTSDEERRFQVHLFQPGYIGLEQNQAERLVLRKQADNVVPLHGKN